MVELGGMELPGLAGKYTVKAVSRFQVTAAGDSVRLYMTCLQDSIRANR